MFRIIFKTSLNLQKLTKIKHENCSNLLGRKSSSAAKLIESENSKQNITFDEMIKSRKQEAAKSLVIQVNSEKSYQELFNYCSQFGDIKSAFHYKTQEESHYILLEFQQISEYETALHSCEFNEENTGVPVVSPFVWFKASNTKKARTKTVDPPMLNSVGTKLIQDDSLNDLLRSSQNLDDQIVILHRATCLNDLGIRMRFMAAKQLETALFGMFPFVQAHPFGSSVNGFGKMGCDLDLILRTQQDNQKLLVSDSRLVFHTKAQMSNERSQTQRQMETLGDILYLFLPGVSNVRRILQARVPIIKFNHECLDLEVDLSMSNLSGLYMSELLYLFGQIDDRVRPLAFCIRKWASACGLTNTSPGRWISNFSLTMLVLFFLQQLRKPILPSLNFLVKSARPSDIRYSDSNINCTFLRDITNLKFERNNQDSLGYLLIQFFEFYSQFNFDDRAISLLEGKSTLKPDSSAMWIVNPLECLQNVSKNVSFEEVERFKFEVKNAAWVLESSHERTNDSFWGLLNLFKTNKQAIVKPQMFFKSRLVDVSDLFGGSEIPEVKVRYKNNSTKNEVNVIRAETKKQIQKLELTNMRFKRR